MSALPRPWLGRPFSYALLPAPSTKPYLTPSGSRRNYGLRRICAPTFSRLLNLQDVDQLQEFTLGAVLTRAPCAVGLDRRPEGIGNLRISLRQIVMIASRTLLLCEHFGQGGWEYVDGHEEWVVFVEGA